MKTNLLSLSLALFLASFTTSAFAAAPDKEAAAAQKVFKKARGLAKKYDVTILRDTWGVPHIYGKTDPDVAFGLAYAHCEDDYPTIQDTMLSTRSLGGAVNGMDAATIDYLVHLLGVWDDVNEKYESDLSAETRALVEAYAEGVNYYAALHQEEVVRPDIFPLTGKDIVAGFVFKSPFFFGLDNDVRELFGDERVRSVSEKRAASDGEFALAAIEDAGKYFNRGLPIGSNTFSVGPSRSSDGSTYLNVNAHQPWEGPVAWYEAHLHSEEGWEAVGGTFPGVPVILHGHTRNLGWAHTVNRPDLTDIYVLEVNPDNPDQYKFDGKWLDFDIKLVPLEVRLKKESSVTMKMRREVVRSVHGPVLRQKHGAYAIRYAGMGDIRQVEQWYRMNRAENKDEWLDAMKMRAIASFNCGYADKEGNILYLYNATLPMRAEGYDWRQYLPGNTSDTLWTEILPFEKLPMVVNPPSGFVQNCNSSPFQSTTGEGNPSEEAYSKTFGIETHMTSRALRALELFGADTSITAEEFYEYKYDTKYSTESFAAKCRQAILDAPTPEDAMLQEAVAVIKRWDLDTNLENTSASLAIMTILPLNNSGGNVPPDEKLFESLAAAATMLKSAHGRIDVPWRDVNRLHRGTVDVGVSGGPDIIHAVAGRLNKEKAQYVGRAGDSYVLLVRWDKDGKVSSQSLHQYGSATMRESSPHYADQVPLFVENKLKPVWFEKADVLANLEAQYRPGEELAGGK